MTNEQALRWLQKNKVRATKERAAIIAALARTKRPISAEALANLVQRTVDRATVYRAIKRLVIEGIVRRIELGQRHALYECADTQDHHHIVCTQCDRIDDFTGCYAKKITTQALRSSRHFRSITRHSLELFGVCNACQQKPRRDVATG